MSRTWGGQGGLSGPYEDIRLLIEEHLPALRSPQLAHFLFQFADYAGTGRPPRPKEMVLRDGNPDIRNQSNRGARPGCN